jgi:hypothetical protein
MHSKKGEYDYREMSVAPTRDAAALAATDRFGLAGGPLRGSTARLAPAATADAAHDASAGLHGQERAELAAEERRAHGMINALAHGPEACDGVGQSAGVDIGGRGQPNEANSAAPAEPRAASAPLRCLPASREHGGRGTPAGRRGTPPTASRPCDGAAAGRSPRASDSAREQPLASQEARRGVQSIAGRLGRANAGSLSTGTLAVAPSPADEARGDAAHFGAAVGAAPADERPPPQPRSAAGEGTFVGGGGDAAVGGNLGLTRRLRGGCGATQCAYDDWDDDEAPPPALVPVVDGVQQPEAAEALPVVEGGALTIGRGDDVTLNLEASG